MLSPSKGQVRAGDTFPGIHPSLCGSACVRWVLKRFPETSSCKCFICAFSFTFLRSPGSWIDRGACGGKLVFKRWYSKISAAGSRRFLPRERPSVQDELLLSPPRQGELASAKTSSWNIFKWTSDLLGCCRHSYSSRPALSITGGAASNVQK